MRNELVVRTRVVWCGVGGGDVSEKTCITVIVVAGPPVIDQGMELLDMSVGETMTLTCLVTAGSGKVTVVFELIFDL